MKLMNLAAGILAMTSSVVFAAAHSMVPMVVSKVQSVANGVVSASMVNADQNGWLVVHRTGADLKPVFISGS